MTSYCKAVVDLWYKRRHHAELDKDWQELLSEFFILWEAQEVIIRFTCTYLHQMYILYVF